MSYVLSTFFSIILSIIYYFYIYYLSLLSIIKTLSKKIHICGIMLDLASVECLMYLKSNFLRKFSLARPGHVHSSLVTL